MSIPVNTIYQQLISLLGAEGSNYYDVNLDIIPAINRAQKYIVSIINSIMGAKKFAESYARELTKVLVFQTSIYSRIDLTPSQPYVFWDILDVLAPTTPIVLNTAFAPVTVPNGLSAPLPTYFYVSGGDSCERKTSNEWNTNKKNPFSGGYNKEPAGKNLKPAYLQFGDYFNGIFPVQNEIEISPAVPVQPVVVYVVIAPPDVTALANSLPFPIIFESIITKCALREISIKSGDGTTTYGISEEEIQTFIKTLL